MKTPSNHVAVVGVARRDDPTAAAQAAAEASLDLLRRVTIPTDWRLRIADVQLVNPVNTDTTRDLFRIFEPGGGEPPQAVVVTARLEPKPVTDQAAAPTATTGAGA